MHATTYPPIVSHHNHNQYAYAHSHVLSPMLAGMAAETIIASDGLPLQVLANEEIKSPCICA